jgi:hypothetical protein
MTMNHDIGESVLLKLKGDLKACLQIQASDLEGLADRASRLSSAGNTASKHVEIRELARTLEALAVLSRMVVEKIHGEDTAT